MNWTANDLPDLSGKAIVITGANSGIGYEAARVCAGRGAHTILACRDKDRGTKAADSTLNAVTEIIVVATLRN